MDKSNQADKMKDLNSFFKSKKRYLLPVIILAIAAIPILLKMTGQRPPMEMPPAFVTLVEVKEEVVQSSETFVGLMEAERQVEIRPRVKGFLIDRHFKEGQQVKEGQLLFQIEPYQYEADLASAQASEISAQAEFVRYQADYIRIRDLYRKGSSTKSDYDERKAAYDSAQARVLQAQAQVKLAELNLSYTNILAPFDSKISDSDFYEGSLIDPSTGQILTNVVSLDPIYATFGISEKMVTSFRAQGNTRDLSQAIVRVKIGGNTYYPKTGRLTFVDSTVDSQTDTIKFKATFENPDYLLIPGQMVMVELESKATAPSLLVPQKAVITDADGSRYVMLIDEKGLTAKATITLGPEFGAYYTVTAGLTVGQKIIQDGLVYMGSPLPIGFPVRIKPESPPAATEENKAQAPQAETPEGEAR